MSTETATTPSVEAKPIFTEKDTKLLVAAFMSLKSGIPDIDFPRFQKNGEFNTLKTAQNTWGTLKKKITALNPEAAEAAAAAKNTTAVPKATPKKRTKAAVGADASETGVDEDGADAEEGTPKKKTRTPRKKKADPKGEADAGDGSPKKKAVRKSLVKVPVAGNDEYDDSVEKEALEAARAEAACAETGATTEPDDVSGLAPGKE